jgi:hypothetical protein
MDKCTIGYLLMGGAVVLWVVQYYQQQTAIAQGSIDSSQTLTMTDRLASPAGAAFATGIFLSYPSWKGKLSRLT